MRNLPPLPLIDGCLFIDNSAWIEGMNTCHRSLQYKSLNLRISAGEKPSLNFGSAIHLALEYRYALYGNKPVDQQYYEVVSAMLTEYFDQHPPPSEDWRGLNWAMEVVRKYNERYEQEGFNLLSYDEPINCAHCGGRGIHKEVFLEKDSTEIVSDILTPCLWCCGLGKRNVMVELPFSHKLFLWRPEGDEGHFYTKALNDEQRKSFDKHDGIPIMYSGRIDVPTVIDGRLFVMDHKTTSMLGDMFWTQMRRTSQQKGYVWAFQELTGMQVHGYVINAIRTKEPPKYVTEGKTSARGKSSSPEQWWSESLARDRFLVSQTDITEWKHNTIDLVEEFMWHYDRDYMPMKTSWCSSYGRCQYYDVCQLHQDDRALLLQSGQFSNNSWSPLNQPSQGKQ